MCSRDRCDTTDKGSHSEPSRIFGEIDDVTRIVAETARGSFGILPNRLDCVAALTPGILTYATETTGNIYVAVDEGVLVKIGASSFVNAVVKRL